MKNYNKLFVYSLIAAAAGALVILSGCKKKETLNSNVETPAWTAPANYDYSSSMTAVIKVDLLTQYPKLASDWQLKDDDMLAAFAGETCQGVAKPKDGLFFLYIAGTEGNLTLRYYSAYYNNIFEATDAITFKNNDHLGTVAQPLTPTFAVKE